MVERQIGYQLKRAQHALRLHMDEALRRIDLTTAQYAALSALEESPGASNAALARACFVTPQTMNAIVVQLAQHGLIERAPHREHGRVIETRLTGKGHDRLAQAHVLVQDIERQMVADLSAAERQQLWRLLTICTTALT